MQFEIAVDIDAPPETVWKHLTDIEGWPRMTGSVTRAELLGDGPFGEGSRARLQQPRLRPAVWTVTAFEPGTSFVWESRDPGIVTTAGHFLSPREGGVMACLTIEQRGPAAPLVGLLYGRLTRRYVTMEAQGLKRLSES